MYEYHGDRRILQQHFAGMRRYFDWLTSYADGHLLDLGLGDWVAPGGNPPEGPVLSSTAHSYLFARRLADIAEVLGDPATAADYRARAADIRTAFNAAFFDEQAGFYRTTGFPDYSDEYRQTSNVLAVAFGLVPEDRVDDVVDRLVEDIRARGTHLDTGILGTRYLLPVLSEHGHADVAYEVATQRTYPSWGHWLELGRTALQEHWEADTRSLNHHMFGSIGHWLYADLAGVAPAQPGWAVVRVRPYVPAQLDRAEASSDTPRGRVAAAWRRDAGDRFRLDARVPPNATGEIHVPLLGHAASDVAAPRDARFLHADGGFAVYEVGPGRWRFAVG